MAISKKKTGKTKKIQEDEVNSAHRPRTHSNE